MLELQFIFINFEIQSRSYLFSEKSCHFLIENRKKNHDGSLHLWEWDVKFISIDYGETTSSYTDRSTGLAWLLDSRIMKHGMPVEVESATTTDLGFNSAHLIVVRQVAL